MSAPWPGIRDYLYIGGVTFARGPESIEPRWFPAKSSVRARSGKLYQDYLQPESGLAVVTQKLELALSWAAMTSPDIRTVNGLLSRTAALDVCPWIEIAESFYFAAGASFAGTLARRNALTAVSPLPALAATRYPVSAIRTSTGAAITITLGTPDADGLTSWTASGASSGEYVTISYTPVYYMVADDGQQSFSLNAQQGQTLRLMEV